MKTNILGDGARSCFGQMGELRVRFRQEKINAQADPNGEFRA